MSHVTTVKMKIKDLDALEHAAKQCGLELVRNQKTYRQYYSASREAYGSAETVQAGLSDKDLRSCDHALRVAGVPTAYEIGVKKTDDGFILLFDPHAGGMGLMARVSGVNKAGVNDHRNLNKLQQEYSTEVGRKQLRAQGIRFTERRVNGRTVLVGQVS